MLRNQLKAINNNKGVHEGFVVQDQYTKSVIFLYVGNEQSKNEIKKKLHLLQIKKNKIPRINLTKGCKTYILKTEDIVEKIKLDLNKWNEIPCSWIGRLDIVKMVRLSNLITDLMKSLSKPHMTFLQKWTG